MTQSTITTCPHCGQPCPVAPEQASQSVHCAGCGKPFVIGGPSASSSPTVLSYAQPTVVQRNGMAIASLVCGLAFVLPFASLLAIPLGIFGLIRSRKIGGIGRRMSIAGIALGALYVAVVAAFVVPGMYGARERALDAQSKSNEHMIEIYLVMYAQANQNHLPKTLGDFFTARIASAPETFLTPRTKTLIPANWATMTITQQHDWIDANSDYILLGSDRDLNKVTTSVILYEKPGARGPNGVVVLYGDGSVNGLATQLAQQQIDQMKVGASHP